MGKYSSVSGKLGIIGAMPEEVSALKQSMSDVKVSEIACMDFFEGKIGGRDAVVVQCNMGKVNAAVCAQLLISKFDVECIINTGVAGSLDAKINIGDIVVSTEAVQHDYDLTPIGGQPGEILDYGITAFKADEKLVRYAVDAVKKTSPAVRAFEGRICSGDQFIASRQQKEKIVSTFGGLCCEMEGAAIAQIAYLNHVPFLIIRAISDKADHTATVDYPMFEQQAITHCVRLTEALVSRL